MRRRDILRATFVGLVALTVIGSDWPLGLSSGFFSERPMLATVLGDLLMITLTVAVIDAFLSHRTRVLRTRVFTVAQDDLANQYNLARRLLIQLAGAESFDDRATRPLNGDDSNELATVLGTRFDVAYSRDLEDIVPRLGELTTDLHWLTFANVQLQARQVEWRRVLAQWSPAMLPDNVLSRVLLTAADFNRRISDLQVPIIKFAREGMPTRAARHQLSRQWRQLVDELLLEMEKISEFTSLNRTFDMGAREQELLADAHDRLDLSTEMKPRSSGR